MKAALLRTTIALLFAALQSGCCVEKISPAPKPQANREIQSILKPLVVGVADADTLPNQSKARELARSLTDSHLFTKVGLISQLNERPDLVIDSYERSDFGFPRGFNCFEPMLYVLSAGVIPSVCDADVNLSFAIRNSKHLTVTIPSARFKKSSVMGWVALPMVLSPDWEMGGEWKREPSHIRNMWLSILEPRKREILSLLR